MSEVSLLHVPRQLVLFRVGETHYGIDIDSVDEILPLLPVTATPGAPGGILGLTDVRKNVVPVFDLHWKFNLPRPEANADTRLILVETAAGSVAMLVDEVEEVLTVDRDEYQKVATPGDRSSMGYLRGVVHKEERLILWVDHSRLAPSELPAAAAA